MIRVVIPFYSEFETAKVGLRSLSDSDISHEVRVIQGVYVHLGRNRGVNDGRSGMRRQDPVPGVSHFLFVDSDIAFSADDVRAALALNAALVTHPYLSQKQDGLYEVGELDTDGAVSMRHGSEMRGIVRVSYTAAGFLLVRADVFTRLPYPWFHHRLIRKGDEVAECGEDVGFCLLAREAGIPLFCNFDRPVYHHLRNRDQFSYTL